MDVYEYKLWREHFYRITRERLSVLCLHSKSWSLEDIEQIGEQGQKDAYLSIYSGLDVQVEHLESYEKSCEDVEQFKRWALLEKGVGGERLN